MHEHFYTKKKSANFKDKRPALEVCPLKHI